MGKDHKKREQVNKPAILLAHFGTTYPSALPSLMNIGRVVQTAFPGVETRHCFTSNMVRKVWTARRSQSALWLLRGVPREILHAQSFLGAVGNLQDENFRTIIVQPTHIYHGEQFEDLKSFVQALQSIRTIKELGLRSKPLPFHGRHSVPVGFCMIMPLISMRLLEFWEMMSFWHARWAQHWCMWRMAMIISLRGSFTKP